MDMLEDLVGATDPVSRQLPAQQDLLCHVTSKRLQSKLRRYSLLYVSVFCYKLTGCVGRYSMQVSSTAYLRLHWIQVRYMTSTGEHDLEFVMRWYKKIYACTSSVFLIYPRYLGTDSYTTSLDNPPSSMFLEKYSRIILHLHGKKSTNVRSFRNMQLWHQHLSFAIFADVPQNVKASSLKNSSTQLFALYFKSMPRPKWIWCV